MPDSRSSHEAASIDGSDPGLAVLGFGKLASALVRGCLDTGFLKASRVSVWARSDRRKSEAQSLGLKLVDIGECGRGGGALLLSIKPQFFMEVLPHISLGKRTTVISVMAGLTCEQLSRRMHVDHVIRAMPNVAAEVRAAVTALSIPANCPDSSRDFAMKLFQSVGRVELLNESHLDAATAISSSGLAYLCLFIEALQRAAASLGLPADAARNLPLDVLQGVAKSVALGRIDPAALRASVTSPDGTTAAALAVLESGEFSQLVGRAARAARDRAVELGQANG